ncbi:MAG: hypothetical protein ABSD99_07090 [Candidatus Bathyarchaeia archaeon]
MGWPPSARATSMLRLAVVQIPTIQGEDCLVYDGGFPSLKAAPPQRGNPGPNPGGRTISQTRIPWINTFETEIV